MFQLNSWWYFIDNASYQDSISDIHVGIFSTKQKKLTLSNANIANIFDS